MAISTDDTVLKFGSADDLDSAAAAVSDGAFSVQGDLAAWTNDDDAPMAAIVGLFTYAVAPDAGSTVELFCRQLNIADTTKDAPTPTDDQPVTFLGAFILDNVTTEQVMALDIPLPSVVSGQEFEFYIRNNGGQTLSSGWSLQITPKSYGPHG